MDSLFAELKKLHDNELFEQVLPIVSMIWSRTLNDAGI